MAFLVHNLPPVDVYVKKEYLYDLEYGHGELTPWSLDNVKSVEGKALYRNIPQTTAHCLINYHSVHLSGRRIITRKTNCR